MQLLKADTLTKVVIGPVVAVADGFTPVTTLALSTADEAEILKHDAAAVTDISGNTFAAITSADGYYNLTITAAQVDSEGRLTVLVNDDSLCLPVRHDFMVVNANVYDSLYGAATTDYLQVDAVQVSGDATAADNLELQYDTTGLTGETFPATQAQVGRLATGAAAISVVAESYVLTTGTEVNTYTATFTLDGVYHQITDAAGALDVYYQFDVTGDGTAVEVKMNGRLFSANDTIGVYAYNWVTTAWDQIGNLTGTGGTSDGVIPYDLLAAHTGTGANDGKVRVRGFAASGLTSATLYLDWVYVSYSIIQSGLATSAEIAALNDVAATDIVSAGAITTSAGAIVNVDTVDVCTTNTDMRGTDSANTVAPDNTSIAAILVDTADMQPRIGTMETDVNNLDLGIIYGTAATGTLTTTSATTNLTGYGDNQLVGAYIVVTSGAAEGERRAITAYTEIGGVIEFAAMTLAMANNDTFKIV